MKAVLADAAVSGVVYYGWLYATQRLKHAVAGLNDTLDTASTPHYLADMCRPVSSVPLMPDGDSDPQHTRTSSFLGPPRYDTIEEINTKFGARSYDIAGSSEWNRLPLRIRSK